MRIWPTLSPKLAVMFSITPFIVGRPVQVLATTTTVIIVSNHGRGRSENRHADTVKTISVSRQDTSQIMFVDVPWKLALLIALKVCWMLSLTGPCVWPSVFLIIRLVVCQAEVKSVFIMRKDMGWRFCVMMSTGDWSPRCKENIIIQIGIFFLNRYKVCNVTK